MKPRFRLQKLSPTDSEDVYKMAAKEMPAEENGFGNSFGGLTLEQFRHQLIVHDNESRGIGLKEGYVPQTIYWFYVDDRPVGFLKLRHALTDYLKNHGGHIGYGVAPKERGKGFGAKMLELGLVEARKLGINKILITCNSDNLASQRVAEKNGGVLTEKTEKSCYYWIG